MNRAKSWWKDPPPVSPPPPPPPRPTRENPDPLGGTNELELTALATFQAILFILKIHDRVSNSCFTFYGVEITVILWIIPSNHQISRNQLAENFKLISVRIKIRFPTLYVIWWTFQCKWPQRGRRSLQDRVWLRVFTLVGGGGGRFACGT